MSVLDRLVGQSSLTPRQLESLLSYARVAAGEIKLREAAAISSPGRKRGRPEQPLTVGSYYRTVSQARKNVKESLVTSVIALWVGIVKVEDMRRLFELVGSGARELSEEETDRFLGLLQVLVQHMIA
jgi:hypothetical protein